MPQTTATAATTSPAAVQRDVAAAAAGVPVWRGPTKDGVEGYRDMVGYGDSAGYVQGAGYGETGGSKAAARGLPEVGPGDRMDPRRTEEKERRQAMPVPVSSTGMATPPTSREKGRRRNQREREEAEIDAPPAYWA